MFAHMRKILAAACLAVMGVPANAVDSPLADTVTDRVQDCRAGTATNMPLIAWGADAVTIEANGGALTSGNGAFADAGWTLDLAVKDDFAAQVSDYLTCESPFLRGTLGMLMAASPVTEADARTEQVVIYKHSWSAGDGIVAADGIANAADLAGKRIAVQAYGPHIDFVARILDDAGLSVDDVDIVWTADLTGTTDSPAAVLERGEADAAAVILPDARVLTSGGAAYDMYLTDHLERATLSRFGTPTESFDAFRSGRADAVAGVRASLETFFASEDGIGILPDAFTSVRQAMVLPGVAHPAIGALDAFVERAVAEGFVAANL